MEYSLEGMINSYNQIDNDYNQVMFFSSGIVLGILGNFISNLFYAEVYANLSNSLKDIVFLSVFIFFAIFLFLLSRVIRRIKRDRDETKRVIDYLTSHHLIRAPKKTNLF